MHDLFEQAIFKKTWQLSGDSLCASRTRIEAGSSLRTGDRLKSWQHAPSCEAPRNDDIIHRDHETLQSLIKCIGKGLHLSGTMESQQRHIAVSSEGQSSVRDQHSFRRYLLDIQGVPGACVEFVIPGLEDPMDRHKTWNELERTVKGAERQRRAQTAPTGWMPVVIGPASGAVVIHEACGHLLEASFLEQGATPFEGLLGSRVTDLPLTIVDDPSLEPFWGLRSIDDEGSPTQRVELIKDGFLQNFLNDRRLQKRNGLRLTGSARRETFAHPPMPRMSCTYLEAGPEHPEALLEGIDEGLYIEVIGGGTVLFGHGSFNFSVESASRIQRGRITDPVRGAFIQSDAWTFLKSIAAVGSNLEFAPLLCGGLSGTVPTSVGQPAIKIAAMLVGK